MHLNNTLYIQWMLETVPDEVLQIGFLKELDILFRHEARWKEVIKSQVQKIDNQTFSHRLSKTLDETELATMHTRWIIPHEPLLFNA